MSIKTRIATLAIAALAITGTVAASTQSAYAGPKVNPVAAGLFGAAVVGTTIIAASQPRYYGPMRRCGWQPQYDMFGRWAGNVRVCQVVY